MIDKLNDSFIKWKIYKFVKRVHSNDEGTQSYLYIRNTFDNIKL